MELHLLENRRIGGYTTFGSVWNRGEMPADMVWGLKNEKNEEIPVQSRVTAWWPDGTVKWAAHTADSEKIGKRAFLDKQSGDVRSDLAKLQISVSNNCYVVSGTEIVMTIPRAGEKGCPAVLVSDVKLQGRSVLSGIYPILILEQRQEEEPSGSFLSGTGIFFVRTAHITIGSVNRLSRSAVSWIVYTAEGIPVPWRHGEETAA